ncbi:hypothetical protein EJ05DRAFT_183439 [Pseudovirgaria hyperparasitica]|uniref:Hemerythrin-like domain-containing protein n=1 Tax=Pseudovirgaria hyperparasitica TaxID=470096 RepID=A0A6A6WIB9_9PEZI|nr:uncharacterized protein EJ05DRAFT_183439 [Pseudovirgaria hyperparasitica]KAF2761736.1 hypothetical protein EJ05DRAFT_183439 [Pseudovirgaria hyperparasitica]
MATFAQAPQDLTSYEYRLFNKMAVGMDAFHEGFRQTWTELLSICNAGRLPSDITPGAYVGKFLEWCAALDRHHALEEEHVFPKLGMKMPVFRPDFSEPSIDQKGCKTRPEIYAQHREIHTGLDTLHEYLKAWAREEKIEVDLVEIKRQMDGFGEVLWRHMDEEVQMLKAENMMLYWTKEEMEGLPFKVKS